MNFPRWAHTSVSFPLPSLFCLAACVARRRPSSGHVPMILVPRVLIRIAARSPLLIRVEPGPFPFKP